MAKAGVRNPIAGLGVAVLASAVLTFFVMIPIFFLPAFELKLFYLGLALFGVGMLAGRSAFLGSLGFIGTLIGGLVGAYFFQMFFWPTTWGLLLTLALGAACGLGGLVSGKFGKKRAIRLADNAPKTRRCQRCGSRVGAVAKRCWSCRAYLPPT